MARTLTIISFLLLGLLASPAGAAAPDVHGCKDAGKDGGGRQTWYCCAPENTKRDYYDDKTIVVLYYTINESLGMGFCPAYSKTTCQAGGWSECSSVYGETPKSAQKKWTKDSFMELLAKNDNCLPVGNTINCCDSALKTPLGEFVGENYSGSAISPEQHNQRNRLKIDDITLYYYLEKAKFAEGGENCKCAGGGWENCSVSVAAPVAAVEFAAPIAEPAPTKGEFTMFYASWCAICKQVDKFIEDVVAEEYPSVKVNRINAEKESGKFENMKKFCGAGDGVPLVVIGDACIGGYSAEGFRAALDEIAPRVEPNPNRIKILPMDSKLTDPNRWVGAKGEFIGAKRALVDSAFGVAFGALGGVMVNSLMKSSQSESGFENVQCSVDGSPVANWRDTFAINPSAQ
ncbi:MAG: hypothetical protein LBG89_03170 [Rickettsiales bacterium]|jgi:hypothetical protein|nr:hypothetical protein [Rickettsiales bacterium]